MVSAFALLLFQRLRTLALGGAELAKATAGTIRQRLLKIGALVTVSTRRVYVRLASAFPLQKLFAQVHRALVGLVVEDGQMPPVIASNKTSHAAHCRRSLSDFVGIWGSKA